MLTRARALREELLTRRIENRILTARSSFWEYEKLKFPGFFKESRPHLKLIAVTLQDLIEGRIKLPDGRICTKLMLNMPPRFGKSFSLTNFCTWVFGERARTKIATISYNEIMSGEFSRHVRDTIDEQKIEKHRITYNDIFPHIRIKAGDSAKQKWSLEGTHFSYLGTSFGGTLTGMGCDIGVIDDPIKNVEEALNDLVLEKQWDWYRNTYLQRLEEGAIQIINMTRWSTKDLCGKILELEGDDWHIVKLKALDEETGEMLCPDLLSFETYLDKTKPGKMAPEIVRANFHQEPVDIKGKLYKEFKTYDPTARMSFDKIIAYGDTADEGNCYLCNIIAGVKAGEAYVLDVYYTQEGMEITEPETARRLHNFKVNTAIIESNNGGRGFARNVERLLWQTYKNGNVNVQWFHQGDNKEARILSNSTYVMNHIYFPADWATRWPDYYFAMNSYQRTGKNKYTDGPDATTGISEIMNRKFSGLHVNKKIVSKNQLGVF